MMLIRHVIKDREPYSMNASATVQDAAEFMASRNIGAVCVVDDASTDETPDVIPRAFPEVRYERLSENVGFSRANNHGIRTSSADRLSSRRR